LADGLLLKLCDERDKPDAVGAQTIDGVTLIEFAESCLVAGMNS